MNLPEECELVDGPASQEIREFHLHQVHLATPQTQRRVEVGRTEQFTEALDPPGEWRDGLYPELSVDLCVAWIVQPCYYAWHPEDLAGQPREHYIGVVTPGDGSQAVSALNASLEEHLPLQTSTTMVCPVKPVPSRSNAVASWSTTITTW